MELLVLENYKTKSNRAISELLKSKWPEWDFNPLSLRAVMKRLNVKRSKKETYAIILNEAGTEFSKKRYEKVSNTLSKHKIGDVFFSRVAGCFYGRLVIKVKKKSIRHYENYVYEKYIGKIPKSKDVVLIDPYGPIVPENLTLISHPNVNYLSKITANLESNFVLTTLNRDMHTAEERDAFKNNPFTDSLITAKRAYIQLIRAIKEYNDARTTANTTNNEVEGTP